ncbi:MAG: type II 3-dehydroquinate dehydratase [Zetaproteobacteria bacterium]|nr:MAG: type II 3-dehydroquinate dehydratase [Zetaproteobacteria bacterium]
MGERVRVWVIHGPNLNLLGRREPQVYGSATLSEINERIQARAQALGVEVSCFQSNSEAEIVERIQSALDAGVDGIVINPAAFTHTSVAIRDALLAVGVPFVEVHLSNVHAREPFRRHSYLADKAVGVVAGFGAHSYLLALEGLVHALAKEE